jgi:hypothetical protein
MRSLGLGGSETVTSVLFNPSLAAWAEGARLEMNCFNRYSLKELCTLNAGGILPGHFVSTGLHVASFGYDDYRESLFRWATARQLGKRWALGVAVEYAMIQTATDEEDRRSALAADVGLSWYCSERLLLGLTIMNYPSADIGEKHSREKFTPGTVQAGAQWTMTEAVLVSGNIGYAEGQALDCGIGLECTAFNDFHIRGGMKLSPPLPSFGIGYKYLRFGIDVAGVLHPLLGASSGMGVSYFF